MMLTCTVNVRERLRRIFFFGGVCQEMVSADDRSQTSTLLFVLKLLVVNMDELSEPHELGKDLHKIKKLAHNVDPGNGSARGPDS